MTDDLIDEPCTDCGGTGLTRQTERPCSCTRHPDPFPVTLTPRWAEIARRANEATADENDDAYHVGVRDGFEEAIQLIDTLTGGDGEYRYSTDDERNCPDPVYMARNIADRIATQQEAIDELVEHIREQTEHFKVRIEDGKQLGATVWRLALEDMVRENAAFLAREKKDGRMDEKQARIFAAIDELETLLHVEKRLPDRKFAEVAERFDVPLPMLLEQWRVS